MQLFLAVALIKLPPARPEWLWLLKTYALSYKQFYCRISFYVKINCDTSHIFSWRLYLPRPVHLLVIMATEARHYCIIFYAFCARKIKAWLVQHFSTKLIIV